MKKILSYSAVFVVGSLFAGTTALAAPAAIKALMKSNSVAFNGQYVGTAPYLSYKGQSYLQLGSVEKLLGEMGAKYRWNGKQLSVTATPVSAPTPLQGSIKVGSSYDSSSKTVSGSDLVANTPFYVSVTANPSFGSTELSYLLEQSQNGVWTFVDAADDAVKSTDNVNVDKFNLSSPGQYKVTYLDNYNSLGSATFTVGAAAAVGVSQLPYTVTLQDGLKLTVNSVSATSTGVNINVTAANVGTATDASLLLSSAGTSISDGGPQVSYVANDSSLDNSIQPGQSVAGNITYGALQAGTTNFIWYFPDFDFNTHSIVFDLSK